MKPNLKIIILFFSVLIIAPSLLIKAQHHCGRGRNVFLKSGEETDPSNARSDTLDVLKYTIGLDMTQISIQQISGSCSIDFKSKMDAVDHINLDLLDLTVDSVISVGGSLSFSQNNPLLQVDLPLTLNQDDEYNINVYYHGHPATDPSWGGFYFSTGYAFNLGVGFDADPHNFGRVWFPCFDNFVEKSSYEFQVLTNEGKTSYCNGILMSTGTIGADSLFTVWKLDEEIPSYLASVAIGDYVRVEQSFENTLGEDIPVWLVAKPADTLEMKQSMINLIPWLHALEESYGPHRFPRVGFCAVPFSGGAMEHATNISYPLFAIDGGLTYETLYAHEIAHHWWGDNITCRTEGDMWINEGWASFSEALFTEYIYGIDAYLENVRANHKDVMSHAHQSDNGRYPVSPVPHEITYGAHVYDKGADIAHTLRGVMGDDDFFTGIQAMMHEYAYSDIDSDEMRDFLQQYTDADLNSFFDNWVFDIGFPEFRVSSFDMVSGAVEIEQHSHYASSLYTNVPVVLTCLGTDGERMDTTVIATGTTSTFEIQPGFEPWIVYLNDSSKISQAVLGENLIIDHNGTNDFEYAEMDLDASGLEDGQAAWMRVENHWATAHQPALILGTDIFISPDRWWSVVIEPGTSLVADAEIVYRGNAGSSNYFDPLFFEYLEGNDYTENDMVLMYRPLYSDTWTDYTGSYTLNVQGSETNWTGKFEIPGIVSGDYAWAVHTGVIGINEKSPHSLVNAYFTSASTLFISSEEQIEFEVRNEVGQLISKNNLLASGNIDCTTWSTGIYFLTWTCGSERGEIKLLKN